MELKYQSELRPLPCAVMIGRAGFSRSCCPDARVRDASRLRTSPAAGSCPSAARTSASFSPWPARTFRPHTQLRAGAVYFMNGSFRKSAKGAGLSPPAIMWRAVSARSQSQRSSCSPPQQSRSAARSSTEPRRCAAAPLRCFSPSQIFDANFISLFLKGSPFPCRISAVL